MTESSTARATNLRRERTTFFGREDAMAEIDRLFAAGAALVTIVGPPGIGKTRLARHYGLSRLSEYASAGGVWFCDLTEARAADDVAAQVTSALGVLEAASAGVGPALVARGKLLLILDNFEQIVAHADTTVARWIEEAPQARVLVTSREKLHLESETYVELEPLGPEESIELLRDRAHEARRNTSLDGADTATIARDIVERLDRLPLAIELAAARFAVLSPRQLLERLSSRLDLLSSGRRDAPAKLGTLRAAIDWSWELLSPIEQSVLAQCTVFRGGFSLEAAEAVLEADDVLAVLGALQDKSMLRSYDAAQTPGDVRFGLLESIREYASSKLDGAARAPVEQRHSRYYLAAAERWAAEMFGPQGIDRLRRLGLEHPNVVALHERALEADPEVAVRAALALDPVLATNGPFDTHAALLDAAVDASARLEDPALRARAYLARAELRLGRGKLKEARYDVERAEHEARTASLVDVEAAALKTRGNLCRMLGEGAQSRSYLERALELSQKAGLRRIEASVLGNLGNHLEEDNQIDRSIDVKLEALSIYRELGDRRMEGIVVTSLASTYADAGLLDRASALALESLEVHRDVGNRKFEGISLTVLANVRHEESSFTEAHRLYDDALAIHREVGNLRYECLVLSDLSLLACEQGTRDDGVRLAIEALALARILEEPFFDTITAGRRAVLDALRGRMEEAQRSLAVARSSVSEMSAPRRTAALDAVEAILWVARARDSDRAGHAAARDELLERARGRAKEVRRDASDCRLVLRVLEAELDARGGAIAEAPAQPKPQSTLEVMADGTWFRAPGRDPVDLSRRHVLRRVVRLLVARRRDVPGEPMSGDALFDEAWPGEQIDRAAAANRLWVTLSTLRKLGLANVLLTHERGYLLDPSVKLVVREV